MTDQLTIARAHYANPERTAAIIGTVERSDVAVSQTDRPGLWAQMMDWWHSGGVIEPYSPPAEQIPEQQTVTARRKLDLFLLRNPDVAELLRKGSEA